MNEHYMNARGESVFPFHIFAELNPAAVAGKLSRKHKAVVISRHERKRRNGTLPATDVTCNKETK